MTHYNPLRQQNAQRKNCCLTSYCGFGAGVKLPRNTRVPTYPQTSLVSSYRSEFIISGINNIDFISQSRWSDNFTRRTNSVYTVGAIDLESNSKQTSSLWAILRNRAPHISMSVGETHYRHHQTSAQSQKYYGVHYIGCVKLNLGEGFSGQSSSICTYPQLRLVNIEN